MCVDRRPDSDGRRRSWPGTSGFAGAAKFAQTLRVSIPALRWLDRPAGPAIELLDQTRLPAVETVVTCADVPALIDAIGRLVVRGAPLLGIAGGYGVALAAARGEDVAAAAEAIAQARPTAVNLGWGARRALAAHQRAASADEPEGQRDAPRAALTEARLIAEADEQACARMADLGLGLVPARARILTHCNTGSLVTAARGSALPPVPVALPGGPRSNRRGDRTPRALLSCRA